MHTTTPEPRFELTPEGLAYLASFALALPIAARAKPRARLKRAA